MNMTNNIKSWPYKKTWTKELHEKDDFATSFDDIITSFSPCRIYFPRLNTFFILAGLKMQINSLI